MKRVLISALVGVSIVSAVFAQCPSKSGKDAEKKADAKCKCESCACAKDSKANCTCGDTCACAKAK